jgi:bacteriocin-like protein
MDKFKELSLEEMQEVDGGFSLWSPSIIMTEFVSGMMETYTDSVEYYHQKIKYQK